MSDLLVPIFEMDKLKEIRRKMVQKNPFVPGFIYYVPFPHNIKPRIRIFACCDNKNGDTHYHCDKNCVKIKWANPCQGEAVVQSQAIYDAHKGEELNTIIGSKRRPVVIISPICPIATDEGNITANQLLVAPIKSIKPELGFDAEELEKDPSLPFWILPNEYKFKKPSYVDISDLDQIDSSTIRKDNGLYDPAVQLHSEHVKILFDKLQFLLHQLSALA